MDIETAERVKYEKVWAHKQYRSYSPGERHAEEFIALLSPGDSVIDYGCGTGRAVQKIRNAGHMCRGIDFASNCLDVDVEFINACLWGLPDIESDWGYCTDVMEHIPPDKVDEVLDGIATRSRKGAYFSIATTKDGFGPNIIGEPLHLTIQSAEWWCASLMERFLSVTCRPRATWATYACQSARSPR